MSCLSLRRNNATCLRCNVTKLYLVNDLEGLFRIDTCEIDDPRSLRILSSLVDERDRGELARRHAWYYRCRDLLQCVLLVLHNSHGDDALFR